jgi:hypothetical protein
VLDQPNKPIIKDFGGGQNPEQQRLLCRRKFLRFFPNGFQDKKYIAWERGYKWAAHEEWDRVLNRKEFQKLLAAGNFQEIATRAVRLESRTNLLFSFEKMAIRDAIRSADGAKAFALGLYDLVYSRHNLGRRFFDWLQVVGALPRKQTRVLTWPVVTVFGFIADPEQFLFLKPNVTRKATTKYSYTFNYVSRPNWETYQNLLGIAAKIRNDLKFLKPQDLIDLQSFLWVLGSEEYE